MVAPPVTNAEVEAGDVGVRVLLMISERYIKRPSFTYVPLITVYTGHTVSVKVIVITVVQSMFVGALPTLVV